MTEHARKYEATERIYWLAWGHYVMSDRPFSNRARLVEIERQIGAIVADAFAERVATNRDICRG